MLQVGTVNNIYIYIYRAEQGRNRHIVLYKQYIGIVSGLKGKQGKIGIQTLSHKGSLRAVT